MRRAGESPLDAHIASIQQRMAYGHTGEGGAVRLTYNPQAGARLSLGIKQALSVTVNLGSCVYG